VCAYAPYPVKVWCLCCLPHKHHYAADRIMRGRQSCRASALLRWCPGGQWCGHNQRLVRKASRESGGR
jgi:hypothetical protein